jgi:regulator of RNase E activity RraB
MPSKQHYGKVRDTLAKFCNKNKEKISVKNDNGEWFIIDNSFNLNESETVHKDTAIDDMDRIGKPVLNDLGVGVAIVMNDVKEHYEKTGETLTLSKILQVFNQQQQIVSNQQEQILQLTKLINEMSYKSPESLKPRDSYFG